METRNNKVEINLKFDVEYEEVKHQNNWIPKTLYKYRDWNNLKHQCIVTKDSIWVPDANDFNDPFDCNIAMDYREALSTKENRELLFKLIVVPDKNGKLPNLYDEVVQKQLFENRFSNPDFLDDFRKAVVKEHKRRNGIFTVTPINNSILVWSHYANSHKGFCVGFDTVKLLESFPSTGAYVAYQPKYPVVSPFDEGDLQWEKMVFTKYDHWSYELEYRLILPKITNQLIKINSGVFKEIIFGANMLESDKNAIREIVKPRHPHIKIYNCLPSNNAYEVKMVEEK